MKNPSDDSYVVDHRSFTDSDEMNDDGFFPIKDFYRRKEPTLKTSIADVRFLLIPIPLSLDHTSP